jgi:hypothetical protein
VKAATFRRKIAARALDDGSQHLLKTARLDGFKLTLAVVNDSFL